MKKIHQIFFFNLFKRNAKTKRLEASIKLVKEFQRLFALMTMSDQKYIDPSDVLNSIVDEYGYFY